MLEWWPAAWMAWCQPCPSHSSIQQCLPAAQPCFVSIRPGPGSFQCSFLSLHIMPIMMLISKMTVLSICLQVLHLSGLCRLPLTMPPP